MEGVDDGEGSNEVTIEDVVELDVVVVHAEGTHQVLPHLETVGVDVPRRGEK